MGKTIGFILVAISLLGCAILAFIMFVPALEGDRSFGASTLGFGLFSLILLIPLGLGVFFIWQGGRESAAAGRADQQRQLLNIVQTRGQVAISDLAIEMDLSRDQIQHLLHDLVGKQLFTGYVNWEEGMLYSRQASQLRGRSTCEVCGGQVEIAGKGVIRCPYCGTEYFLD
jgi:hypothetical protein